MPRLRSAPFTRPLWPSSMSQAKERTSTEIQKEMSRIDIMRRRTPERA